MMKTCFKCGQTKLLSEFYRHPMMADGHLNKCKECTRRDTRTNRQERREYYLLYDRRRYDTNPERCQRSEKPTRQARTQQRKRYRARYPERFKANAAVGNAIRDGRLIRKPCEICGSTVEVEAHHEDYSKPLDVRWLCKTHHGETRRKARY